MPARFSVLVALSLAVLAGFGVRRLLASVRGTRTASLAFGIAVIASVANVWPVLPLLPVWSDPPPVYGVLSGARDVVLAEFPVPNDYVFNTQHVLRAVALGADDHRVQRLHAQELRSVPAWSCGLSGPGSAGHAQDAGVTHVTVNCALYRGGCDALLDRIDGMTDFRKVAEGRWQGQRVRLYEMVR